MPALSKTLVLVVKTPVLVVTLAVTLVVKTLAMLVVKTPPVPLTLLVSPLTQKQKQKHLVAKTLPPLLPMLLVMRVPSSTYTSVNEKAAPYRERLFY
jgi:ribose/xylose/arabinose/galactoside ABC-type transport system permease subunit